MNELLEFIKQYREKTFSEVLKEEKIDEKKIKQFDFIEIKAASIDVKERTVEVVASKEVVDRQGDVIQISGIEVDNFVRNPVVPFAHNYGALPVARAIGIKVEGDELIMKLQFPTKEVYDFGDTVFKMLKDGFLNAVSIGFIPLKQAYDETVGAFIIEKSELLEVSIVPVPANQEALVRSYENSKEIDKKTAEKVGDIMVEKIKDNIDPTKKEQKEAKKAKERLDETEKEELTSLREYKEAMDLNRPALKSYRKWQVLFRDVLGVTATEDEVETIDHVMTNALAMCELVKASIAEVENQPEPKHIEGDDVTHSSLKKNLKSTLKAVERINQ